MYARMFDELMRSEGDHPTVGIICSAEEQLFGSALFNAQGGNPPSASSYKTKIAE